MFKKLSALIFGAIAFLTFVPFATADSSWLLKSPIPVPLVGSGITSDSTGKIYMVNGTTGSGNNQTLYVYDPANDSWQAKAPLPYQGNGLAITYYAPTNKFYAGGGWYNISLHNFYEYDPTTDTWIAKAPMIYGREWVSLISASNGKIYAVSGDDGVSGNNSLIAPIEEYDPATDTWTLKASIPVPTTAAKAVLAPNGKIYLFGGHGVVGNPSFNAVQEYDPATDTWTEKGVYTVTLTVTDSAGANNTSTFQYVSVYNPTSQGLFSAGHSFNSPAGAYAQNSNLTGNVTFGLAYKYQGTVPTSNREFTMNFKAANLLFNATTISSLVVANSMATLTGTGTINGSGIYNFLVTGVNGGDIRIQITDPANNNSVIYDTQPGDPATATPTTSVNGNVVAHN